ncbi:glycerophosphodiester phosphodiesterase [Chitinophaga lutea]
MRLRYQLMIPAMMAAMAVQAQSIQLDNHAVPAGKKGAAAGKLYDRQGTVLKSAKLAQDTSGLFTISKGQLKLKKNAKLSNDPASFKYAVTVENGGAKEDFIIVRDDFHRNKIVAHRGAWKNNGGSQNSITSFRDAVRIGCEGSEFDVWLSSDGVPVLSHDPHIGGHTVEETPLATLQAVQLKNGDRVPTFEEYIQEAMKQNTTKLVLELKPSKTGRGQELAQKCMDLIRKYRCEGWMLYISFDYDICKKVNAIDPFAKVAYLNGDKTPAQLAADKIWGFDYNWKVIDKTPGIIADAHKNKVTVNIWTVNEADKMEAYLKAGADYLTTDEPELALEKSK